MQLNIGQKVIRALEIERSEALPVFLLLTQSVFIGIFNGAFDIAGNSLFLEKFPSDMLPKAFIVSGVAGILLTALYTFFQNRIGFKTLAVANLIVISFSTVLLWIGTKADVGNWIYFALLVMMGPLMILSMLGFWGTAGRIFSLRQGKRLFGLIDSGQIVGFILSSYAIPVLLSFGVHTQDMLLICTSAVVFALLFQLYIVFRKDIFTADTHPQRKKEEMAGLFTLMKNRFVKLMAFFVGLSMICAFFVYFSFLDVTKTRYPDAAEFAKFFGFFTGTVMVFTFLVKTTVYGWFMKTYGLRTSLVISPLLLLLLTAIASIAGSIGGIDVDAKGFIFFFLVIVLSRLLSRTLKDSIEAPSFKILYQSVDKKVRYNVQSRVDGTVNEFSALFSGVILTLVGLLTFVNILHYSLILLILLAIWSYVAFQLYSEYKKNLSRSLSETNASAGVQQELNKTEETSHQLLNNLKVYKLTNVLKYNQIVNEGELTNINNVRAWVESLKSTDRSDIQFEDRGNKDKDSYLDYLMHSHLAERRRRAAVFMALNYSPDYVASLKALLRDNHPEVRNEAIKAAIKCNDREIYSLLTDNLLHSNYARQAFETLFELGDQTLDSLEQAFHKTGNDISQLVRVVRLIGCIGGEKANKLLLPKIQHSFREVSIETSRQLLQNNFKANESNYYQIQQVLTKAIGTAAWNISMRQSLQGYASEQMLGAINEEVSESIDFVFLLLSLMYDSKSIEHIRQTLDSGEGESAGFALELLDLLVAEDIKPMLFPLFDDTSVAEKIKQLQEFFPLEKKDFYASLIDIINRDTNQISLWAKACALIDLGNVEDLNVDDNVLALVFHPEPLICQLAADWIVNLAPDKWEQIQSRVPESNMLIIKEYIFNKHTNTNVSLDVLVNNLKKNNIFGKFSGKTLYTLAKRLISISFESGSVLHKKADRKIVGVWLASGSLEITLANADTQIVTPGLYLNIRDGLSEIKAVSSGSALLISEAEYQSIMFDYPEMVKDLGYELQEKV